MKDAISKYIELMKGRKLWPPMNNYTFFGQGSAFNTKKYFRDYYPQLPPLHLIIIAKEGDSMQMAPADTFEYCSQYTFTSYLEGSKEPEKRFHDFDEVESYVSDMYERYGSDKIAEIPTNKLLETMDEIRDKIWHLNCYIFFTLYFDRDICAEVLKSTKSSISRKRLDEIWEKATHSAVESFEIAQKRSVLASIAKNKSLEYTIGKARYIFANYFSVESFENVAKKITAEYGSITANEARLRLNKLDVELRERSNEFGTWSRDLSKDEQNLVWYIQRIIEYRDRRKNLFAKAYVIWWMIYEKVLIEAGIDHSLMTYIQFDEVMRGVHYLKSHHKEIEARRNGAVLLIEYNGTITLEPIDYDAAKQQLTQLYVQSSTSKDTGVIKGQTGSPGKVIGKIRIILNARKANSFEEGEILVTGMTRPEFVPIMKKASAIITDEGGITCHAAIVARELKKPCVIGTRIATHVLKDGDMVEVDASSGIVTILKKA